MEKTAVYSMKVGNIGIAEENEAITRVYFANSGDCSGWREETPLLKEAASQLKEYFSGTRQTFSLPLAPRGTDFQQRVWQALLKIPYGETRSYGEVARMIGNEKASRAVGMANNRNPIVIVIPCHRVVGADGSMVGYGGGLPLKVSLLELEKNSAGLTALLK